MSLHSAWRSSTHLRLVATYTPLSLSLGHKLVRPKLNIKQSSQLRHQACRDLKRTTHATCCWLSVTNVHNLLLQTSLYSSVSKRTRIKKENVPPSLEAKKTPASGGGVVAAEAGTEMEIGNGSFENVDHVTLRRLHPPSMFLRPSDNNCVPAILKSY